MRFAYMKDTEEQLLYYQFPKFLLEIPLSRNARIVYCLLQILLERYAYSEIGGTFILI